MAPNHLRIVDWVRRSGNERARPPNLGKKFFPHWHPSLWYSLGFGGLLTLLFVLDFQSLLSHLGQCRILTTEVSFLTACLGSSSSSRHRSRFCWKPQMWRKSEPSLQHCLFPRMWRSHLTHHSR